MHCRLLLRRGCLRPETMSARLLLSSIYIKCNLVSMSSRYILATVFPNFKHSMLDMHFGELLPSRLGESHPLHAWKHLPLQWDVGLPGSSMSWRFLSAKRRIDHLH